MLEGERAGRRAAGTTACPAPCIRFAARSASAYFPAGEAAHLRERARCVRGCSTRGPPDQRVSSWTFASQLARQPAEGHHPQPPVAPAASASTRPPARAACTRVAAAPPPPRGLREQAVGVAAQHQRAAECGALRWRNARRVTAAETSVVGKARLGINSVRRDPILHSSVPDLAPRIPLRARRGRVSPAARTAGSAPRLLGPRPTPSTPPPSVSALPRPALRRPDPGS